MECLDARVASFAAITRPKRSAKVAFPLDPDEFPHLTPENLAQAGFYHVPGKESDPDSHDTCCCFLCGLILGGWDTDDDPFAEHVKRDGECAWKEIVCRLQLDRNQGGPGRLRTSFPSIDSLPSSAASAALRLETFGKWWPHKKPSAKEIAKAGFIYTPSAQASDGTTCPLCLYEVVEWETGDDPSQVHYGKEPDCPFFTSVVGGKKAPVSKARAKPAARRGRSTVTTTKEPEAAPEVEAEDDSLELPDPEAEEEAAASRRRGRAPKASTAVAETPASTASKSTRGGRRKTAASKTKESQAAQSKVAESEVEEGHEPEEEPEQEEAPEPKSKPKRATKPLPRRTTRTTRQTATAEPEEPPEPAPAPKPRGRPKKATTTERPTSPVSAPAAREPPAKPKARSGKSAPTRTKPLAQTDSVTNVPTPSMIPVMSPKPPTVSTVQSPSVRQAVATLLRESTTPTGDRATNNAPETPTPVQRQQEKPPTEKQPEPERHALPLTDAQRSMTLEAYLRHQYQLRLTEMRADGEAMIQKFEARARERRKELEQRE